MSGLTLEGVRLYDGQLKRQMVIRLHSVEYDKGVWRAPHLLLTHSRAPGERIKVVCHRMHFQ